MDKAEKYSRNVTCMQIKCLTPHQSVYKGLFRYVYTSYDDCILVLDCLQYNFVQSLITKQVIRGETEKSG